MSSAFWWPVTHTPVLTGKGKLVVLLSSCFHVEGVGDTVGGGIRWVGRYCREILETSKPKLYFCQLRSLVFFSVFKRVRERNHFFSKLHNILYQNFHNFQRYRTITNLSNTSFWETLLWDEISEMAFLDQKILKSNKEVTFKSSNIYRSDTRNWRW